MGRYQKPRNDHRRRGGQGQHLRRQHQPEARRAVGAEAAVAHDLQRLLAVGTPAESVTGVGKPVLVKRPGGPQRRGGGEHQCQGHRKDQVRKREHPPATAPTSAPTSG